ncbi:MAG: lipopolysaccharide heptosyltransferase II [Candidatus Omnitrophica bacterium]|nr:lipopolysaccharide heptosyltransferase II [Candidatus Omnitrophota bacterium]
MKSRQRILVIRLDRLGDVVLSLPVLSALRAAYPQAHLAMLVRNTWRGVVEGHPAVDEVLAYDKDGAHRGILATVRFAWALRRHAFSTAVVLHATWRSHWIAWLAGIPGRIGYARKGGRWLLTRSLPDRKAEGQQHEARYALDLLKAFGFSPTWEPPMITIQEQARRRVSSWLSERGVAPDDGLIAVHPGASCPSKRWPIERFAEVVRRLEAEPFDSLRSLRASTERQSKYEQPRRVVVIGGAKEQALGEQIAAPTSSRVVNACGQLSVEELAALLARCACLISNDSGPVHVAAAVGTPVVSLFGRNQQGLSWRRWGPLGESDRVLHHEVGCITCLAHRCTISFRCLQAITVEEVITAVRSLLGSQEKASVAG